MRMSLIEKKFNHNETSLSFHRDHIRTEMKSIKFHTLNDVERKAYQTLAYYNLRDWEFHWNLDILNPRERCVYGLCYPTMHIELNRYWVQSNIINTPKDILDILRHEIAHALDWVHFGILKHGPTWKSCCRFVGAKPSTWFDDTKTRYPKVV